MATWTISGTSPTGTLAALGIDKATLQFYSGDTDRLFLRLENKSIGSDPSWDYNDPIVLNKDGSPWFQGVVRGSGSFGEVTREGYDIEIHGPWEFLERNQYLQQRQHVVGSLPAVSAYSSECLLGLDASDARQTVMATVEDVVNYAIARGANLLKGTIASGTIKYVTTAKDMTIAEVIRQLLRWEPDILIRIDYSTSPSPTIHMVRRASATTVSFDVTAGNLIRDVRVKKRPDLQIAGCVIYWNKLNTIGDSNYLQIDVDKYPGGVSELAENVAHFTMDLEGFSSTYQKSAITTATLPTTGTVSTAQDWIKRHVHWLSAIDTEDLTLSDWVATVKNQLTGSASTDATEYPRELLGGTIFPWMSGIKSCVMVAEMEVSFTGTQTAAMRELFGGTWKRKVAVRFTATDATDKTYKGFGSFTPGETTPTGYAQAYYTSLATLQHEAVLDLEDEECDGSARPGKVLNLTNGLSGWATMRSIIYSVSEELLSGQTHIEAGPQAHVLGPSDYQQLARANRANGYRWKLGRASSEPSGDAIDGGVVTASSADVTQPRELERYRIWEPTEVLDGSTKKMLPEFGAFSCLRYSTTMDEDWTPTLDYIVPTLAWASDASLSGADATAGYGTTGNGQTLYAHYTLDEPAGYTINLEDDNPDGPDTSTFLHKQREILSVELAVATSTIPTNDATNLYQAIAEFDLDGTDGLHNVQYLSGPGWAHLPASNTGNADLA